MRWTRDLSEDVVSGQSQLAFVSGLPRVNGYRRPGFGLYRRSGSGTCLCDRQVWRGGVVFNFPEGLFHWTGGGIQTDGAGGDGLVNDGVMQVSGAGQKFIAGQQVDNAGTIIHSGSGPLTLRGGSAGSFLNNLSGAVYEFRGEGTIGGARNFNNSAPKASRSCWRGH